MDNPKHKHKTFILLTCYIAKTLKRTDFNALILIKFPVFGALICLDKRWKKITYKNGN